MRRPYWMIAAIAAMMLLASGCGSSSNAGSTSNEQTKEKSAPLAAGTVPFAEDAFDAIDTEVQPDNKQADAPVEEQKVETAEVKSPADATAVTEQKEEEKKEEKKPEAEQPEKKPSKKKVEKKVEEATKSNAAVNQAVTDSIMDNIDDKAAVKSADQEKLKKAIEQIRTQIKELKQNADSNDAEKMKASAATIMQSWESMKADVKSSAPSMVDFLSEKVKGLNDVKDAETVDQAVVLQLDYELYQAFRQLADKLGVN
ncbi:hypothetical protein H8B09_27165 [Paenibacillus sp. PR3]|uniref:Lipoprotein n=1 Tax=Paenibacillus terricola TaxID=2763503 RepID=A0ABR8N2R3_9BACL|nr:hypothetical protein [Paenibacillus terricola]MBD3922463.1 hypothetical protein [Paenibacillus terricola]